MRKTKFRHIYSNDGQHSEAFNVNFLTIVKVEMLNRSFVRAMINVAIVCEHANSFESMDNMKHKKKLKDLGFTRI